MGVETISVKHSLNEEHSSEKRLKMSSPFSIRLLSTVEKKFRRGEIQYIRNSYYDTSLASSPIKETLQTPALILYTRRLVVPHVTYDMLEKLNLHSSFLHVNTEACILDMPDSLKGDLISLVKPLSKFFTIWSSFDSMAPGVHSLKHGRTFIQIRTEMGLHKITAEEYMKIAVRWNPDCITTLAAPAVIEERSKSQAQKFYERWHNMLDQCIVHNEQSSIPLLATLTSSNSDFLLKSVEKVTQHLEDFNGVVFNTNNSEIINASKNLPMALPRLNISMMTPNEILSNLENIDIFPTTFAHILAELGYAMNLNLHHCHQTSYLELHDEQFRTEKRPLSLDNTCPCWACAHHNAAYIYHLLDSHEMLGLTLLSMHNLVQLDLFVSSIRKAIDGGCLQQKMDAFLKYFNENLMSTQDLILEKYFNNPPKEASNGVKET